MLYSEQGVKYTIADISKNGGNGLVISKNNSLMAGSDKLTIGATLHANGKDYWISINKSINNTDSIYLYLFTKNGISPILKRYKLGNDEPLSKAITQIKFSPNGKYLFVPDRGNGQSLNYNSYLYSFNNKNGDIIFKSKIKISANTAEFSPNNEYLYLGVVRLYQLKISQLNDTFTVDNNTPYIQFDMSVGAIQLATNGKIYLDYGGYNNDSLKSIIHYPNSPMHKIGFQREGIVFENYKRDTLPGYWYGNTNSSGFSHIVSDTFMPFIHFKNNCSHDSTTLTMYNGYNDSILWYFGDGTSQYSNAYTIKHKYADSGFYNITAIYKHLNGYDTIYKTVYIHYFPKPNLGNDTLICTSLPLSLSVKNVHYTQYTWNTGDTTTHITIKIPGQYKVLVANKNCSATDSIKIDTLNCTFNASKLCLNDTTNHTIDDNFIDSIHWKTENRTLSTINNTLKYKYQDTGFKTIKIKIYKNGLFLNTTNTIYITGIVKPMLKDTIICKNASYIVNLSNYKYDSIVWNNKKASFIQNLSTKGGYTYKTYKNNCYVNDTLNIYNLNCGINKQYVCLNDSTEFSLNDTNFNVLHWHFGDGNFKYSNKNTIKHKYQNAGIFYGNVEITKFKAKLNQSFAIEIVNLPKIQFNLDTIACYNQKLFSGINNEHIVQRWIMEQWVQKTRFWKMENIN